ncbi:MAG TPA: AMP-binding protein, partial [Kofleriaceae bacterium]
MAASSLVELEQNSVRRYASRPLFGTRHDGTWSWLSYREVGELVDEIRGGLAALGVRHGDRVAIVSRNSAEWAAAAYATYGLGATFVPMYEAQRAQDWEFILRDCGASVVFARGEGIAEALTEMQPRLSALRHVVTTEGDGARSLRELRETGRAQPVEAI